MISTKRLVLIVCLVAITLASILISDDGNLVLASGKKKFLKGFILGALLGKSHYPVVYTMPSHGGGHSYGGGHGGYGF